ncbi:MAG: TonB-dependent receptor [Candidatus Omnitrophica bacterium]|nr:TonB-dependent receptor [Candidatus Omnitrophota bacterium]
MTLTIAAIFALFSSSLADEPVTLERIVVSRPSSGGYPAYAITGQQIERKNLDSFSDGLDYLPGVDLRSRGHFGIQGDLSFRGSTYEQVDIAIDGVKFMDPQTGHYNLDIPLTQADIERMEVTSGGLAGSVNIVTKDPGAKGFQAGTLFGEHALSGEDFSLGMPGQILRRVSFEHKEAKAAVPNTDFEYNTASLFLAKELEKIKLDTLFGYQQKDYGADSFYSNNFPEEEEHTRTILVKTGVDSSFISGSLKNNLYLRRHDDKFILRRNNPGTANYHTTYVYGFNSRFNLPPEYQGAVFGLDIGRDEINSSNLGKHNRLYEAGSVDFSPRLTDKLALDLGGRIDHYQKWGNQESYNFGSSYDINEKIKIDGSFRHSFRLPTFTELYYSDAANIGSAELKAEKSDNFQAGLNFKDGFFACGIDAFLRRGENLIDWTRVATSDPWQVTNLGRVDFYGAEFNSRIKPKLCYGGLILKEAVFSYSHTVADKKTEGYLSKYALDILAQRYILEIYSGVWGLDVNWQLSYSQRDYGETYFVGNLNISKEFSGRDFSVEPFFKIDNFSDTEYSEVGGVVQPGRWIKSGLKLRW